MRAWLSVVAVAAMIAAFYLLAFPLESRHPIDVVDTVREFANFLTVVAVTAWARRDVPVINFGLASLLVSLWMEVVDEFTAEPHWMGTDIPVFFGVAGLLLLVIGVREAARRRHAESLRHADSEEALRRSHGTLQAVVEGNPDPVWVKDLSGAYVLANAACVRAMGRPQAEVIGRRDVELMTADQAERAEESDRQALASGGMIRFEDSVTIGGELRTFLVTKGVFRDAAGKSIGILGVARDITDRKVVEDRLVHQASHDTLTGLPNRSLFMDRLERELARARRQPDHLFAVLFVDIDRFKEVNDRYGHGVGDEVLVNFTRALNNWLRPGDLIARLGGDEFTVLLPAVAGLDDAVHVAERIREGLRTPLRLRAESVATTVSIGVAISSPEYQRAQDLVRDADAAMYHAKQLGRNQHAVYLD